MGLLIPITARISRKRRYFLPVRLGIGLFTLAGIGRQCYMQAQDAPPGASTLATVRTIHSIPLTDSAIALINLSMSDIFQTRYDPIRIFNT